MCPTASLPPAHFWLGTAATKSPSSRLAAQRFSGPRRRLLSVVTPSTARRAGAQDRLVSMRTDRLDPAQSHQSTDTATPNIEAPTSRPASLNDPNSLGVILGRPLRLPTRQALRVNCAAKAEAVLFPDMSKHRHIRQNFSLLARWLTGRDRYQR
jgi:hypothetical protein